MIGWLILIAIGITFAICCVVAGMKPEMPPAEAFPDRDAWTWDICPRCKIAYNPSQYSDLCPHDPPVSKYAEGQYVTVKGGIAHGPIKGLRVHKGAVMYKFHAPELGEYWLQERAIDAPLTPACAKFHEGDHVIITVGGMGRLASRGTIIAARSYKSDQWWYDLRTDDNVQWMNVPESQLTIQ